MKILFSPSESKKEFSNNTFINENSFIFKNLYNKRKEVLDRYNETILNLDNTDLSKLFGLKEFNTSLKENIYKKGCIKAVQRYDGTAYKQLSYNLLDESSKKYIDENVIIFSNLFGPILAKDLIPDYKLKQGNNLKNFKIDIFYKENFSNMLDRFLENEDVLDLRAGFYEKFYTIRTNHASFKFVKDGKIVSHYAKLYRGKILKQISKCKIKNFKELSECNFDDLKLIEIQKKSLKSEFIFKIYKSY